MPDPENLWEIPVAPPVRRARADAIIEELDDESLALVLWLALRQVWSWVDTPIRARGSTPPKPRTATREEDLVFARASAPDLGPTLDLLLEVLGCRPEHAGDVARAAGQVAEWAEVRGHQETAIHYAEAAAAVEPRNPVHANRAGRVNRRALLRDRAELWYSRAITLARQSKVWGEYIRGHLGLGALWYDLGEHSRATPLIEKAARRARRQGLKNEAAEAYHDLMLLSAETGAYSSAEEYARRALEIYPIHHRRLPYLVADFSFLLVCEQAHDLAIPLLEAFLAVTPQASEQVLGTSTLAAAAGGAGDVGRYDLARRRVLAFIGRYKEHAAPALVNLGKGARALGKWEAAREYVAQGVEVARARGDAEAVRVGTGLLAELDACERPASCPPLRPGTRASLEQLAAEMRRRLARWKGPAWQRKPGAGPGEWAA